jgi:flavin-dependent dehydrogenase
MKKFLFPKIHNKSMEHVKILGAGPSGLSAAINLASEGYSVDVFEKNNDVGSRVKRNLQGLENWSDERDVIDELKKMNITPKFDYQPFKDLIITNGEQDWDFSCHKPAFYIVSRGRNENSLDQGLKKIALDNGVNLVFEETIPADDVDIIATGPNPNWKFAVGRGLTFKTEHENIAVGLVNNYHAFKGYSYLIVSNGCGCIATVLFEGFNDLNESFKRTFKAYTDKYKLIIEDPCKFSGYGSYSNKILKTNDKILVGESAGFQDLLWGFGIKNAIKSGFLAAKTIVEGDDPKNYYETAEEYFKPKLNAGIVNRFFWEKFASNNYSFILNQIHGSEDPLKYLHSFHNFNLLQKLIYPFALFYMKYRYPNLKL